MGTFKSFVNIQGAGPKPKQIQIAPTIKTGHIALLIDELVLKSMRLSYPVST